MPRSPWALMPTDGGLLPLVICRRRRARMPLSATKSHSAPPRRRCGASSTMFCNTGRSRTRSRWPASRSRPLRRADEAGSCQAAFAILNEKNVCATVKGDALWSELVGSLHGEYQHPKEPVADNERQGNKPQPFSTSPRVSSRADQLADRGNHLGFCVEAARAASNGSSNETRDSLSLRSSGRLRCPTRSSMG